MTLINAESHQTYSLRSRILTPAPCGERGPARSHHDHAAERQSNTVSAGGAAVAGLHAALRLVPDLILVVARGLVSSLIIVVARSSVVTAAVVVTATTATAATAAAATARQVLAGSDLRKLNSGKPLTSYIAQAELCKSRLNSASYLLTGQFNM